MPTVPLRAFDLQGGQPSIAHVGGGEERTTPPAFRLPTTGHQPVQLDDSENIINGYGGIVPMELDVPFDPTALGLKEIGNLASWTVSSCKPGCGVEALRDDDTGLFWQ